MNFNIEHLDRFYIDGGWVPPIDATPLHAVLNPANAEVSGHIAFASPADVEKAIASAHAAFDSYSQTSRETRIALFERICEIYERRLDDMARAITLEMGAPLETLARPLQAAVGLWHFQTALQTLKDYAFEQAQGTTLIVKEPIGVCSMITPWNWPMNQVICKVAPALAVGCTMVLKPSQNAPYSAVVLAEILEEAQVPRGVFNMLNGEGRKLGELLASHALVDMVSLTGSTQAGASLTKAGADTIKKMSLELGGKSANIILEDANLDEAVTHGVLHMMSNSGQTCTAPSRMLVPRRLLSNVEAVALQACAQVRVGDPLDSQTTMGPIANERQYRQVTRLIQDGVDAGARLLCGGLDQQGLPEGGYYVAPTIFTDVHNDMQIAQEEIFGPVLVIIPYEDEDDAIRIANDSIYGLSGYVHASSTERALAIAKRMRTGMVHVCGAPVDLTAPFGGYKQSGNGREWGRHGFEEFLEVKAIMGAAPAV